MQMGMSSNMADLLLEMSEALNSGLHGAARASLGTKHHPTSIETFVAEQFLPRFTGKAAGA